MNALIISYYWPPSGGIGVLRCLKFAKYLEKIGWKITVYTVKNGQYPYIDESNNKDVPKSAKIIRSNIWEPYNIYRFITGKSSIENVTNVFSTSNTKRGLMHKVSVWIRSNFFIPDARAKWIKPSVNNLSKFIKENSVDIIISNGPPHSNTRIACLLKKKFPDIYWHADFQDPWTQVDYFSQLKLTFWGERIHTRMEQEVFQFADSISIVSPSWKKDLESIGANNVKVLEWGYDLDDFKDLERVPDQKFSLAHIGIMGFDRNPKNLFRAIKELINENKEFSDSFQLKIVGELDFEVKQEIEKMGLAKWVHNLGHMDRKRALQETMNSQILLLLLNQQPNAQGRIPGKLFEYLAVERPILVLGPEKSDSGDIVESSLSGKNISYSNFKQIKKFISESFVKWKTKRLSIAKRDIDRFSNQAITTKLADLIKKNRESK